ncbi:MAG: DUF4358 domain-containing protein [Oscillospiraceae bacterium]|nr:DUF4358 domain-containing protein [Oscillospiraceae bacterium]
MKKIILSAILCGSLILTLAGCGNKNNDNSDSSSGVSSEESSSEQSSSESSSENSGESSSENSGGAGTGNEGGVDNSALSFPDNRAGRMAAAALRTDVWPAMDVVSEVDMIGAMFSTDEGEVFNLDDLEEYCFCTNVMSAQLNRVIVVKPVNGREGAVEDAINTYLNYSQTGAAFYPAQEESAAGAVSGKTPDNYIYLIVHKNGGAIADAIANVQ